MCERDKKNGTERDIKWEWTRNGRDDIISTENMS